MFQHSLTKGVREFLKARQNYLVLQQLDKNKNLKCPYKYDSNIALNIKINEKKKTPK